MTPRTNGQARRRDHGRGEWTRGRPAPQRADRVASRRRTCRACLSRMPGNWHVRFYVPRLVMLKLRATPRFRAAQSDFIG